MTRAVTRGPMGQPPPAIRAHRASQVQGTSAAGRGSSVLALVLAWLAVSLPLAWGITETFRKALALFS